MEKRMNLFENLSQWTTYCYFAVVSYIAYFGIKIGKKFSDFLFEAAVEKMINSVADIVKRVVTQEVEPIHRKLHGVVAKNEAVLMEALEKIERIERIEKVKTKAKRK
jgi:hypothetical protein